MKNFGHSNMLLKLNKTDQLKMIKITKINILIDKWLSWND